MAGNRPDFTVSAKSIATGKYHNVGAWWRKDGKLSGGWDRKIVKIQIRYEDGTVVTVSKGERFLDHYLNLQESTGDRQETFGGRRREAPPRAPRDDFGGDDF